MSGNLVLLGVSGSIRPNSFNTQLLTESSRLLPRGASLVLAESLADIPLTSPDAGSSPNAAVKKFQEEIEKCDGIVFSTPQFNYNIPTALKVAISWAQLAGGKNAWAGKPGAVIGASVDTMGTLRAQEHLHQIMSDLKMQVYQGHQINLLSIETITLSDYQEDLQKFLHGFVDFVKKSKNS